MNGQRTAHFVCRQRAAVQAKAVAIFARRKAVVEDVGQILRWNPDPVIHHGYPDPAITVGHAHRQPLVRALRILAGVFGVAQQVDHDLQEFVLLEVHGRHRFKFADHLHIMAAESTLIQAQAVFHQIGHVDHFLHPAEGRVVLLHGYNFLDVLDVPPQRSQLAEVGLLLGQEMFGELGQMSRHMFAPGVIGDKLPQVMRVFLEQQYDPGET